MLNEEFIDTNAGRLKILKLLGKGKSGYSYLAEIEGEKAVLKIMHDEPCDYYDFGSDKISLELKDYQTLCDAGINIPKLIHSDSEKQLLVKEYIPGTTADQYIAEGRNVEFLLPGLFKAASQSRNSGINIDFFPTNFVWNETNLFYIDYEVNPYDAKWDLENWGIFYWANAAGMKRFLKTGDASAINVDPGKGIPIKDPFKKQISDWVQRYKNI